MSFAINSNNVLTFIIWLLPLFPWGYTLIAGKAALQRMENKFIPVAEQDHIKSIVRSAVTAVEQTCPQMLGPQKRSEAVRIITQLLSEHGLNVSPVMLDTLIEQAVFLIGKGNDPTQTQLIGAVGQVATVASSMVK